MSELELRNRGNAQPQGGQSPGGPDEHLFRVGVERDLAAPCTRAHAFSSGHRIARAQGRQGCSPHHTCTVAQARSQPSPPGSGKSRLSTRHRVAVPVIA
eukprot:701203-Rhodomonas_salina.2